MRYKIITFSNSKIVELESRFKADLPVKYHRYMSQYLPGVFCLGHFGSMDGGGA